MPKDIQIEVWKSMRMPEIYSAYNLIKQIKIEGTKRKPTKSAEKSK